MESRLLPYQHCRHRKSGRGTREFLVDILQRRGRREPEVCENFEETEEALGKKCSNRARMCQILEQSRLSRHRFPDFHAPVIQS